MHGTLNFTVDPGYVEMNVKLKKNQKTLEAKLVRLCGGSKENGARLNTWWGLVTQSLKLAP